MPLQTQQTRNCVMKYVMYMIKLYKTLLPRNPCMTENPTKQENFKYIEYVMNHICLKSRNTRFDC